MGVSSCASKVFILIYLVNQNFRAGSAQAVTLPFQTVSVSSKTSSSSAPSTANTLTFSPASLPPVQTQQNLGQNYQALGQSSVGSGPSYQNVGLQSLPQNVGQNLLQGLNQPCDQSVNSQEQYCQSLTQPLLPSGVTQNVNPFISNQNVAYTPNQSQNSGLNNILTSPTASTKCLSPSSQSGPNVVSGSPTQGSTCFNLVSAGQPNVNIVSSGLNVVSPQNSGLNYGSLNLVTLNSNYVPSQSSSNNLYPANLVSVNGCSGGGQNVESLSINSCNGAIPPSVPSSNAGFAPQFSFNIQPSSQTYSSNQPVSNSALSPQTSLNVSPSSVTTNQPQFTLTSLRPLNSNSGSNINLKSISFQPNCHSPPQIPSTLPSATPCNSAQTNQYSLNLGITPSLLQDINSIPPPTYGAIAPPCIQDTPQVSISPSLNFQPLSFSNNQQLSSSSNPFFSTQNVNTISQQSTNSGPSCNTPVVNPSINFGQFTLQNPVNSGVPSCSSSIGQSQVQTIQSLNTGVSPCNSQVTPSQTFQNTPSGTSLNIALDQQMINQLFSSIISNTPVQQPSYSNQVSAPQLNSYVQSSLQNIPTTCDSNAYNNVGSSYVSNCGSTQTFGNALQNPPNSQFSNNIYSLYNQQSFNPYSASGSQLCNPCTEYSNTLSSLPTVYTSNLASASNSYVPGLTPASILSAYTSNSVSSPINFESILSALKSPTITTEEIASLVSSLAESVLQQCNSLTSSSSACSQSNHNSLPISVSTAPVESNYIVPSYSNQYIPQQQSVSYYNPPSIENIENSCATTTCSGAPTGIPIKVTISDAPFSSDLYSSSVQPYYSLETSALPPVYPSTVGGGSGKTSNNMGIKDFVKILVLSELFNGGSGGCGGSSGVDNGLLALLLATTT